MLSFIMNHSVDIAVCGVIILLCTIIVVSEIRKAIRRKAEGGCIGNCAYCAGCSGHCMSTGARHRK